MSNIEELKKDSAEFGVLAAAAKRQRVKDMLVKSKAELDKEITNLEMKARIAAEREATGGASDGSNKRYIAELTEYAWDQSDKFVKLFINLDGVQQLDEESVKVHFTENSMNMLVCNLNNKDYRLEINNLLEPIDVENSYRKIKTGIVAIYLKKRNQNHWSHLTTVHKRISEKKAFDAKTEPESGPEDNLVNIMKKMYNSGDAQTKQMIAKAWTESQEKVRTGQMYDS